ncbi:hypothetical protein ACWIID_28715 [Streptomyces phaeochromogenes]
MESRYWRADGSVAAATAKTTDGPVEIIRLFKLSKTSAVKSRSMTISQLKAVPVTERRRGSRRSG